mmetsp:Transcript_128106/g.332172  ORF Transcript_128106/g.332172 Transcript_128106/m.332172 type:complete len:234 (-) Transcript_128106:871-1572(-)
MPNAAMPPKSRAGGTSGATRCALPRPQAAMPLMDPTARETLGDTKSHSRGAYGGARAGNALHEQPPEIELRPPRRATVVGPPWLWQGAEVDRCGCVACNCHPQLVWPARVLGRAGPAAVAMAPQLGRHRPHRPRALPPLRRLVATPRLPPKPRGQPMRPRALPTSLLARNIPDHYQELGAAGRESGSRPCRRVRNMPSRSLCQHRSDRRRPSSPGRPWAPTSRTRQEDPRSPL